VEPGDFHAQGRREAEDEQPEPDPLAVELDRGVVEQRYRRTAEVNEPPTALALECRQQPLVAGGLV